MLKVVLEGWPNTGDSGELIGFLASEGTLDAVAMLFGAV